jgi:hypothetical protein
VELAGGTITMVEAFEKLEFFQALEESTQKHRREHNCRWIYRRDLDHWRFHVQGASE